MAQLIDELFVTHFDNELLRGPTTRPRSMCRPAALVMSTDGHVISPLFFPGGDIGSLAVHGTLNDVAMAGARPLCTCRLVSSSKRVFRSSTWSASSSVWVPR